jgi:hypothetical protein
MNRVSFAVGCLLAGLLLAGWLGPAAGEVIHKQGKTFIVDQTGSAWEVSQAMELGFSPSGFDHGLGRGAFTPLGEEALRVPGDSIPDHLRVVGFAANGEAAAVSVRRLGRNAEVANLEIGGKPVAVTY